MFLDRDTSVLKKKARERYILEKFVSNTELKLLVKNIKDCETPDFIIQMLDKKISAELTSLINPKLKEIESFQDELIELAEKMFLENYNVNLRV